VRRPDVENYLGTQGVAGFQIDVGAILGYSVQDATKIVLSGPVEQLDTAFILDSPIGMNRNDCFPAAAKTGLDRETIENLSRRLRMAEVDSTSGDWREITCILGCEDNSAQSAQWAEYLADKDQSPKHIAAMQVQRMTNDLGVPALDPLPNSFESVLATKSYATSKNSMNPSQQTLDKEHQQNSDTHPRVAVAGLVHHKSGLGQNVRNSLAAFELAGIHACPLPFFPARGGWNSKLGMTQQAASSMADHSVQLHLPVDKVISALSAQPALLQTERLIGYFMWETETIPRQLHRALNVVDEIWTATDFVAEAFRSVSDTPVFITGHAVDVSKTKTVRRSDLGIDENAFVVHYAFDANSTVARKNPNAALDAFDLAFGNDPSTEFILKIRNMQQVESLASQGDPHAKGLLERLLDRPRVRVITRETTHSEALGLIQLADCFLSLHRSEGYGYGIAEAIALGTPVVATNYSGSLSLTNSETAWLIPFEHIEILPGEYFYWQKGMTWAEPDLSRAAESLVAIRRGEGQLGRVQSGARHVANTATLSALSANYASLMSADRAGLQQV